MYLRTRRVISKVTSTSSRIEKLREYIIKNHIEIGQERTAMPLALAKKPSSSPLTEKEKDAVEIHIPIQ